MNQGHHSGKTISKSKGELLSGINWKLFRSDSMSCILPSAVKPDTTPPLCRLFFLSPQHQLSYKLNRSTPHA